MTSAAGNHRQAQVSFGWWRQRATSPDGDPKDRRTAFSRFLLPLAFVAAAAVVVSAVIGYRLAVQLDEGQQVFQREQVLAAIEEYRGVLADITAHIAGDITIAFADGKPLADVAAKLKPMATSRYRFAQAFLVGEGQTVIAAYPEGAVVSESIVHMVEAFRAGDMRPVAGGAGTSPSSRPSATTDLVALGEQPALAALAQVAGDTKADAGKVASVLVMIVPLDARIAALIESESGIEGLRLTSDNTGGRVTQSLLDRHGRIVGWLSWKARRPVVESLTRLLPLIAIVAACLVAFAMLAIQQIRSERRSDEEEFDEDPLTHLANRERLFKLLDRALIARAPEQAVMLAFFNLDNFKDINDAFGHRGGDFLLAAVASRLKEVLPVSAALGRIGGDEFAVVLTAEGPVEAVEAANTAMNAVAQPFRVANQSAQVSVSVGLALAPRDGETRDELARRADLALRAAKRRGRGNVVGFELQLEQEFHDRRFIMRGLRRALAEDSLDVVYQPIVTVDANRIVGVEALLRWRHRTRGDIPPEVFVPIAEQAGLMPQLGEFVLRRALAEAARWKNLFVAVNLSPVQVRDPELVDLVAGILKQTGTPAARVVLEITEGVLIDEPEKAIKRLEKLRALGLKIALDDFGSGYSSLRYLQRFPIDKLKIDKSFVAALGTSESGDVIIQAMIALGHALGLSVLAEGVETEEQKVLLRVAGCDELQGHLIGRPLPSPEVDVLLAKSARSAARATPAA